MSDPAADPRPELSIVIPVYDEAERLPHALESLAPIGRERGGGLELVLSDDGSRDGSAALAERLAAQHGLSLVVARSEENRGKGDAVRRGMLAARGRFVLFTDVDLAVPLSAVEPFVEALRQGADVAIGSRRLPGAEVRVHQPWLRELLGARFRDLARLLVAPGISDFTCGFKAFRAEAAREIFSRQRLAGWSFDAEILLIARRLGLRVVELPVAWTDDHRTRVRLGRDIVRSGWELALIRWHDLRGRYRGRGALPPPA